MKPKLLNFILLSFLSLAPFFSGASEKSESFPSILCDVLNHSKYEKTIVFGSGKREVFLFQKDRNLQRLEHENFDLIMSDNSYLAVNKKNNEVLLSITSNGNDFVKIKDNKSRPYPIANCIILSE